MIRLHEADLANALVDDSKPSFQQGRLDRDDRSVQGVLERGLNGGIVGTLHQRLRIELKRVIAYRREQAIVGQRGFCRSHHRQRTLVSGLRDRLCGRRCRIIRYAAVVRDSRLAGRLPAQVADSRRRGF